MLAGQRGKRVHGGFADSARRRIDHTQQGNIIVRINRQAGVGQGVLDFRALIERKAAEHPVTHAARAQGFLKGARLRIRAIQHTDAHGGIVAMEDPDAVGGIFRFGLGIASFKENQIAARRARGYQILSQTPLVMRDDFSGRVQNFLRRAVILLETHDARAGIIFIEAQNVADIRAAPSVDGLILVPDDAEVARLAGQQAQEVILYAVGVLILVDVDVAEAVLPCGARLGKFL